jgi:hypothetical protein
LKKLVEIRIVIQNKYDMKAPQFLKYLAITIFLSVFFECFLKGQHCCPIVESYLGGISVEHSGDSIRFSLKYCKMGGSTKAFLYQSYLIAYLEKNESQLFALDSKDITKNNYSIVLINRLINSHQNDVGTLKNNERAGNLFSNFAYQYPDKISFLTNDLANKIIKEFKLNSASDTVNVGGWCSYSEKFKIAFFVPFLEDTINSNNKKLPEYKHECNYDRRPYLLFQPLPYTFQIKFGSVIGVKFKKGDYYIHINNK